MVINDYAAGLDVQNWQYVLIFIDVTRYSSSKADSNDLPILDRLPGSYRPFHFLRL